jgi:RNA polymerase-binding transcription factor DksA
MKSEDLLRFDKLVTARMRELLVSRFGASVGKERQDILDAAYKLDDAVVNEFSFALRRIEKGIYGQCVICRHDIPIDVLEDNLSARLCPPCEAVMHEKSYSSI